MYISYVRTYIHIHIRSFCLSLPVCRPARAILSLSLSSSSCAVDGGRVCNSEGAIAGGWGTTETAVEYARWISIGPPVVLLHGFPEIWYSWRHQMVGLAKAGFRAIAPNFRGYGLSRNTDPSKNHWIDCVDDILGLLDALHLDKVYVVAKDWGAIVAYCLGFAHAERILALAVLGIPFSLTSKYDQYPAGHYVKRWSMPGIPEADFGRFDVATVIKRIYILFSNSKMPLVSDTENTLDLVKASDPLPDWMTEEDLQVYAGLYEKSGFAHPMEVPYRCMTRIPSRLMDRKDFTIPAPILLVIGDRDYVVETRQLTESDRGLQPKLTVVHIEEGSHFVQEQFPDEINELLIQFLTSQRSARPSLA